MASVQRKRARFNIVRDEGCRESHPDRNSESVFYPGDINGWTEEDIRSLSIEKTYQEQTTPLELLHLVYPQHGTNTVLTKSVCEQIALVERFINEECAVRYLDKEFDNITFDAAKFQSVEDNHSIVRFKNFLELNSDSKLDLVYSWLNRYQGSGVRFGELLHCMVLRRDLDVGCNGGLSEHDFQLLFDSFASMFGLQSYTWVGPLMRTSKLQVADTTVYGKADILFCKKMHYHPHKSFDQLTDVLAVCQVKKQNRQNNNPPHHEDCPRNVKLSIPTSHNVFQFPPYTPAPSTSDIPIRIIPVPPTLDISSPLSSYNKCPPHISASLVGQHGGAMLLYYTQAVIINNAVLGIIVQGTKVTFTALQLTQDQYIGIKTGKHQSTHPKLIITKPYDYMIKEERAHLIRPLLELAMMQKLEQ